MSSRGVRENSSRGYPQREMAIDLNLTPNETRDQEEGTSHDDGDIHQVAAYNLQGPCAPSPPTTIDVDAIDDDVVELSASAFAEAKSKSRTIRERPVMLELFPDSMSRGWTRFLPIDNHCKRRRIPPDQPVVDCDVICANMKESVTKAPPPPQEPTFKCPICMDAFKQETSTKCGHIFCKECIKSAIAQQSKCPTCRKRVTVRELIRVFLPATR